MFHSALENAMEESEFYGRFKRLLISLVLVFVPLILRVYIYDAKLSNYPWFPESSFDADIFLHYKGKVLVGIAVLMLLLLLYEVFKYRKSLKGEFWLYFLGGYAFLSTFSTIFSSHRYFGLNGMYEHHESLWVLLAYCIVTFYAFFMVRDEKSVKSVVLSLAVLAMILSFIGISQLIGKDFFETDLAKAFMVSNRIEEEYGIRESLGFGFSGSGNHQVYLTMYNPNYVGSFVALVFPIFVSLTFAGKTLRKKLFWGSMAVLHFLFAMGSGSKTFLGSFVISGLMTGVLYRKQIKKGWKIALSFLAVLIFLTGGYFYFIKVNPIVYVKNALSTKENANRVGGLEIFEDRVELIYNKDKISISFSEKPEGESNLKFLDEKGEEVSQKKIEGEGVVLERETYEGIEFYFVPDPTNARTVLVTVLPEGRMNIVRDRKGYSYLTAAAKEDEIVNAPTAVIENHDAFASGRGYIWSRTFPILKKHFLLGSGADSFVLEFPQNDYIGKLNGGFGTMNITKPHNIYLQIGVQTGILSLVCYLASALIFLIKAFGYYWKNEAKTMTEIFGAGIALGIIGYLVSGIFNDSIVAVAPIYWVLLGVGYGVLRMIKKV